MNADLSMLGLGTMGGRVAAPAVACGLDVVGLDPVRHTRERASSAGVKVVASADVCRTVRPCAAVRPGVGGRRPAGRRVGRGAVRVDRGRSVHDRPGHRAQSGGIPCVVETVAGSGAVTVSNLLREPVPRVVSGDHDPVFALDQLAKDNRLAPALVRGPGTPAPIAEAVTAADDEAVHRGLGAQDGGAVPRTYDRHPHAAVRS